MTAVCGIQLMPVAAISLLMSVKTGPLQFQQLAGLLGLGIETQTLEVLERFDWHLDHHSCWVDGAGAVPRSQAESPGCTPEIWQTQQVKTELKVMFYLASLFSTTYSAMPQSCHVTRMDTSPSPPSTDT